jgi:hypothetical protein
VQPSDKPNGHRAQQCTACGKLLTRHLRGRQKKFCSAACRDEARRAINFAILGRTRPEPRNTAKNPCGTGAFLRENRGRASGIVGPRHVLEVECGGFLRRRP